MNKEEAYVYLGFKETDNELYPDEAWENVVFVFKQKLISRPLIRKVLEKQLQKISKQYEAFQTLSDEMLPVLLNGNRIITEWSFPDEVLQAFHVFHSYRNTYKLKLSECVSFQDLSALTMEWMEMEEAYQSKWSIEKIDVITEPVSLGKEPDPMELITLIKDWESESGERLKFSELENTAERLPRLLKIEVKRLTLLWKKK
jgi:hypothetical protein